MDLLSAFITFGGGILCMAIPVFLLGIVLVWLAPRISAFFENAQGPR
jgi:hypothetical protein